MFLRDHRSHYLLHQLWIDFDDIFLFGILQMWYQKNLNFFKSLNQYSYFCLILWHSKLKISSSLNRAIEVGNNEWDWFRLCCKCLKYIIKNKICPLIFEYKNVPRFNIKVNLLFRISSAYSIGLLIFECPCCKNLGLFPRGRTDNNNTLLTLAKHNLLVMPTIYLSIYPRYVTKYWKIHK